MKQQAEEELERAMLDQEKLQRNQKEKEYVLYKLISEIIIQID